MRVGGPAARLVVVETADELVDAVREVDDADEPLLVVGGGSNLVVADAGFDGHRRQGRHDAGCTSTPRTMCGGANVTVAAGEDWDGFVARAVEEGWSGIEALSGIPGLDRRDAGAERRCLRPGGRPDDRAGAGVGPHRPAGAHDDAAGLPLHVPALAVQGHRSRYVVIDVMFQLVLADAVPAGALCRPRHPARGRGGGAGAAGGGAGGGARPAPPARDGARRRGPRHVELRVVLHQPDPVGRRTSPPSSAGSPAGSARTPRSRPGSPTPTATSRRAPPGSSSGRGSARASGCRARPPCRPSTRSP